MWWAFVLLCLLGGLGYARFGPYLMDGDSVSFMDIADGLRSLHPAIALNSYWNPLYPALLALAQAVAHPSRWTELHAYAYLNVLIFAGCLGATVYLADGLVGLQRRFNPNGAEGAVMSPLALRYAAAGILFFAFQRELLLGFIRSDSLLLLFFLMAAGVLLRIQAGGRTILYAALGLTLGLAYLTKSFAFLPAASLFLGIFLFGITRKGAERARVAGGAVLAGIVFSAVAGPYILGISRQMGHFTTGESARLNYAFFVDEMPRWHEWAHHDLAHAGGVFVHPELALLESPPVFSFRNHPVGTLPPWLDPAYFTAGVKPHVWIPGHVKRVLRCSQLLVLWLVDHPEGLLLLAVLLLSGATLRRLRSDWWPWLVVPGWGLLMLAIYFPIDLQERYLTTMLILIVVPLLAMLRRGASEALVRVANGTAVLLALIALLTSFHEILNLRRQLHLFGRDTGLYSGEIFGAAEGLGAIGVKPGDAVGCMGYRSCYVDPYWARLAGVQIMGEIEVPDAVPRNVAWNSFGNKEAILSAFRSQGIHYIVTDMPGVPDVPDGWRQLGGTAYFVYPIPGSR
ncbi:MAG: hypothetical protein NVSMB3_01220 [Acidobacteriaceae bacterium]